MERKFRIESRADVPIAYANWSVCRDDLSMYQVEKHCRDHQINWRKGLYRLVELKPIKVEFKTIVDFQEFN